MCPCEVVILKWSYPYTRITQIFNSNQMVVAHFITRLKYQFPKQNMYITSWENAMQLINYTDNRVGLKPHIQIEVMKCFTAQNLSRIKQWRKHSYKNTRGHVCHLGYEIKSYPWIEPKTNAKSSGPLALNKIRDKAHCMLTEPTYS